LFDGSDDYLKIGDPVSGILDFGANQPFSINFWFKGTNFAKVHRFVHKRGTDGYDITYFPDTLLLNFRVDGTTSLQAATVYCPTYLDGQWHMVTAVRALDKIQLFVDSQLQSQTLTAAENLQSTQSLTIGNADASPNALNGAIDEVRFYNRDLTTTEIAQLYNYVPNPTPQQLLLNWLTSTFDQNGDGKVNALDFAILIP
jgi:hypothetical protein